MPSTEPDDPPRRRGWRRRSAKPTKAKKRARWWELPVLLVIAVGVAILLKTFVVQPFSIPSASMEKTLHGCEGCSGDRIVVNKVVYEVFRDPHPGDIVVFKAPDEQWRAGIAVTQPPSNPILRGVRGFGQLIGLVPPDEADLVKRVIAVGGQTVKCCDADGNVQVSDDGPDGTFHSLDDSSFVYEDPGSEAGGRLAFGPITVPKDRLWVMGDHRNDSEDSRYHCDSQPSPYGAVCNDPDEANAMEATVPVSDVIGKAVIIAWPPSRWTTLGTPKTFGSVPLPSADGPGLAAITALAPLAVGSLAAGSFRHRRRTRRPRIRRRPPPRA